MKTLQQVSAEIVAENLWDEYSQYVENSSFGFDQVAGTPVVLKREFLEAANKCYLTASAAAAKREQELTEQLAEVKSTALAFHKWMSDNRYQYLGEPYNVYRAAWDNYQHRTEDELYDLFRKETGR